MNETLPAARRDDARNDAETPVEDVARRVFGELLGPQQRAIDALAARLTKLERALAPPVEPGAPGPFADLPDDVALYLRFAPPGHYYSPLPDRRDLLAHEQRIFAAEQKPLPGINIDAPRMAGYIGKFAAFYGDFPFVEKPTASCRFHLDNGVYSRGDAVVLYSMMRYLRPRRIIEIGSGLSTCLMLDVAERFLDGQLALTTIDPFPERMLGMLRPGDAARMRVIDSRMQDVDREVFDALERDDILFVDSSHVSKCDSDVNALLFDILPRLQPGVCIHFHDMFWPFEYPREWLLEIGAAWNEAYALRAFLQYNSAFTIELFSDYVSRFLRPEVEKAMPVFVQGPGSSLWLRRSGPAGE